MTRVKVAMETRVCLHSTLPLIVWRWGTQEVSGIFTSHERVRLQRQSCRFHKYGGDPEEPWRRRWALPSQEDLWRQIGLVRQITHSWIVLVDSVQRSISDIIWPLQYATQKRCLSEICPSSADIKLIGSLKCLENVFKVFDCSTLLFFNLSKKWIEEKKRCVEQLNTLNNFSTNFSGDIIAVDEEELSLHTFFKYCKSRINCNRKEQIYSFQFHASSRGYSRVHGLSGFIRIAHIFHFYDNDSPVSMRDNITIFSNFWPCTISYIHRRLGVQMGGCKEKHLSPGFWIKHNFIIETFSNEWLRI